MISSRGSNRDVGRRSSAIGPSGRIVRARRRELSAGDDLAANRRIDACRRSDRTVADAILAPLADLCIARWSIDLRLDRGLGVAIAASVAGGAAWKLFHSTSGARWFFVGGLAVGLFLMFLR